MDIIEKTRKFVKLIKKTDEFIKFSELKEKVDTDENLKKLNEDFDCKREELNNQLAADEPDKQKIKDLGEEMRKIYLDIHDNKIMKDYDSVCHEIDYLLNNINMIINESVRGDLAGEYFSGCGGECSSCSGCF